MPGLDVAKFATQVVAGYLQRIMFAPFQPGITELVGDLVQLILDVVHALLEAAHVAADFVAVLLGRMHPPAVVIAGKERSEEHKSELQSLMRNSYAVFCLKKKIIIIKTSETHTYTRIEQI